MVQRGDMAPEFEASTSAGDRIRLADYRGKKNVVVFFYPGDFTPVCTKEACGFRDLYAELRSRDTEVIGISSDTDESHRKFASTHDLGYPLLSDPDRSLAKLFGATGFLTTLLGRTSRMTFVIDKAGKVAAVLKGEISARTHLEGVQAALANLDRGGSPGA
jgi:peroxiredoxin Q/BCP